MAKKLYLHIKWDETIEKTALKQVMTAFEPDIPSALKL